MAVPTMPVPMGLVSSSTSPAARRHFVHIRSGWTAPVTAYPNLISRSRTVWPPSSATPASRSVSTPPEKIRRIVVGVEPVFGKAGDRQRRQWPPAHRVDVAQRVRRRDLPVDVGVVDDRREEVHRLHQRRPRLPRVHTGIVSGPEVHQDARVGLRRNVAQHVSELAGGEFARSTSAAHQLGETLFLARHEGILLGARASGLGVRGKRSTCIAPSRSFVDGARCVVCSA